MGWSSERLEIVEQHLRYKDALSAIIEHKVKKCPHSNARKIAGEHTMVSCSESLEKACLSSQVLISRVGRSMRRNEVYSEDPINPHAPSYSSEALPLSGRYEVRSCELRLRAEQAQAQVQVQAIEEEMAQLRAKLEREFERMFTCFQQNLPRRYSS